MHWQKRPQQGAALLIALVLLTILTLLAVAGAGTSTAELVMAGNEEYRERASNAASAGIERELARIRASSGVPSPLVVATGPVSVGVHGIDTYTTRSRYVGDESVIPGSSVGRFAGHHHVIESIGRSSRGAIDSQTQGVLVIRTADDVQTLGRIGAGVLE